MSTSVQNVHAQSILATPCYSRADNKMYSTPRGSCGVINPSIVSFSIHSISSDRLGPNTSRISPHVAQLATPASQTESAITNTLSQTMAAAQQDTISAAVRTWSSKTQPAIKHAQISISRTLSIIARVPAGCAVVPPRTTLYTAKILPSKAFPRLHPV